MLRALRFLLVAAVLLVIVWWVGSLPGTVTADVGRYVIVTSTPASVLILVMIALLLAVIFRVLGGLRRAPWRLGAWRGGRRQRLGELATQRAIVALAAGDAPAAKTEAGRAQKLIGEAPLVLLVQGEAARLAGDEAQARIAFEKLTRHKDMAFLGHHGLIRHSLAQGAHEAAHGHALAAQDAYPGSPWLREKRLEIAVKKADWPAALALTKAPHEVAALATAAANEAADPAASLGYAKRAVKAAPASPPAVLAYARALRAAGKPRAARKALLAGWKAAPQPDLAAAFLAFDEAPLERAKAAGELAAAAPGQAASELVLAQTALAAQLPGEARRHALAAQAAGLHDGRAEAVLAALDGGAAPPVTPSVWQCDACQAAQPDWSPACVACGRLGRLAWRAPGAVMPPATANLPVARQ
jgi:HemY protein